MPAMNSVAIHSCSQKCEFQVTKKSCLKQRICCAVEGAFSLSLVGRVHGVQKVTKREQGRRARSKTSILLPIPSLITGLIFLKRREFIGFLFKLGILTVNLFFVYLFIKVK